MPRPPARLSHMPLAAVLLLMAGCNLIGGAAVVLIPKPPVPAQYDLPDKRTLVLVEDRHGLVRDTSVVRQVTASIRHALEDKEVVTAGFVPQPELTALQAELGDAYARTSLMSIGRQLGAQQVIYAKVTGYQLEVGGGVYQPAMSFEVKVIDMDAGGRSFPAIVDEETGIATGIPHATVMTQMRAVNRTAEGNAARSLAARELADQAGLEVAQLFFEWRRPEPGDMLRDTQP